MFPQSLFLRASCLVLAALLIGTSLAAAESDQTKALKYHKVLVKRPDAGYLFDRFYNTWLDHGTVEELGQFLEQQVEQSKTTADQLLLSFFYSKQGNEVRALELLSAATDADPDNAQAWFLKAETEARTLAFDAAIADLERAKKAKPDEKLATEITKLQGKLYVRNRQTAKALEVWQQLLAEHADDEDLHEDIIELQISEGLYEEAAAELEKLIAQTTDKYKQVLRKIRSGDVLQRAGKRSEATQVYADTLEQVGHGTWLEREILAQVEELYRREDDLSGLQEQYEKLLEQYPRRVQVLTQFAKLLVELGDHDAAQEQMARVLELTPGDRANTEAYIALLAAAGNQEDAIKAMKALIDQHPEDGELQLRLATLHHNGGNKTAAAEAVKQYLAASDKSEYAFLRAARMLVQFEAKKDAESTFQQLVDTLPNSLAAKEALAAFLYDQGRKDEALSIWRQLAEKKDLATTVHIARILASRNEHRAAYDLLHARHQEFSDDSIYLGQLVGAAIALEKYKEAVPWVRRRVQLAQLSSDLEIAVTQAAQVMHQSGQSLAVIRELTSASKRSAQDTCLLAELLEQSGDVAQAEKVLDEAARQNNAFALSQKIRLHAQRGDWRNAAEATKALMALAGERKTTHVQRLVEIYQRDDQLEEAVRWVQEWKKLSPGSVMPWLREARLLTLQDKSDDAISVLRVASQKFEGDVEVRAKLAALYEEAGLLADAERIYWRLYEDGKNLNEKIRWAQRLAAVAEMDGTTQQLVERFEERHRTNRRSIEPLLALAEIHRIGYDYEQRHKALMEASRLHPDDLQLLQQIARIEESEGDYTKALDTLRRAAELDNTTRTREQIARLHLNNGEYDRGYAVLDELANNETADARSIEGIAMAMASMGDWERLVEFLGPRTEDYSDDYRLRYLLAVAHEEATNLNAAKHEFLNLLLPQKSIPGLATGQTPQTPWAPFLGPINSLLPAESQEIMQLGWLNELAYQHRDQSSGFYSIPSISQSGSAVAMPPDAPSVRQYALTHLLSMGQELEDDALEDLTVQMQSRGVSNAKMLFEIPPSVDGLDNSVLEIAANYPDSNGLLALSILSALEDPKDIDDAIIQRAYDAFKDDRPQLAFMAAILLARMDEAQTAPLEQAIADVAEIKTPNVFLIIYIAFALGSDFDVSDGPQVPEKYHPALTKQLLAWYPHLPNLGPQGFMVFYFVANALSASEDPTDFLAMLDDEVVRWRSNARQSSFGAMSMFFGSSTDQQLIRPIRFPPGTLADFPPHVLSLLSGIDDPFGSSPIKRLGPEAIAGHLNKVKDPTLRTLLAYPLHREEVVNQSVEAMLAANPPSLDAFLLAAAKETEEMNYSAAAQLLDKARYLPMTRDVRQRIDGALVALATEADPSSPSASPLASGFSKALSALAAIAGEQKTTAPPASSLADLGRAAALRLRRMPLQSEQRAELITALDQLGLEKEAERLEESQANQPMASSPSMRYYGSGTQTSQIVQFLGEGKTDQAIRLIAREFTTIARNANAIGTFDPDEHHDLRQTVYAFGLVDRVFTEVDPGQSTNLLKLTTHGYVCETFEKIDEALDVYQKVVARQPKNSAVRNRLLLLTLQKDVDAAVETMRQCDPRSAASFGMAMCSEFERLSVDTVRRQNIVDASCRYLDGIPPEDERDLTWLDLLADHLSDAQYFGTVALPTLYQKTTIEIDPSEEFVEASKMRREAHNRLCRAMLKHPSLATDGFSRLLAAARRFDEPLEPFVPIAIQALTTADKVGSDPTAIGAYHMQRYYRWYYTEMWDAEEFLVRQAWSGKDEDLIPDVVVAALAEAERPQRLKHISLLNRLFICAEAEYVEAAEAYIAGCTSGGRAYTGSELDGATLSMVVQVWKERKLHVDLQPLLITRMREAVRRDPSSALDDVAYPGTYAVALVEIGQQERVPAFLEAAAEICLGPKDRRQALVDKYIHRGGYSSGGAAAMRIMSFVTFAQSTMGHPELTFVVLDFLKDNQLESALEDFSYVLYELFEETDGEKRTEQLITFLDSSPFLCELSDFDIVPIPDSPQTSVLGRVLSSFSDRSDEDGKKVIARLRSREPQTFGTKLVIACLEKPSPFVHQALIDHLVRNESAVRALSPDKARSLAHFAREIQVDAYTSIPLKGDAAVKMQGWLDTLLLDEELAFVDNVLAARKLDQVLDEESADLQDIVMRLLPPLVSQDHAKAKQFFCKLVELLSDDNSDYYYDTDDLFSAALQGDVNEEMVVFLLDRYLDEENLMPLSEYEIEIWTAPFVRSYEKALDQATSSGATSSALESLYGEFTRHFKDRPTTIFASSYCNLFKTMSAEELKLTLGWLADKSKSGPHSQFARELLAAAQWTAHEEQQRQAPADKKAPRPETMQNYHKHYVAVIQDEALPLHFRLAVIETLYAREGETLPIPVVLATTGIVREALRSDDAKPRASEWRAMFALQSLDQTPAWRAEAESFMEAWNDRYLTGSGDIEESHPSVALKLNLMLGNEENVQRMLRKRQDFFQDITNVAQLVRFGHHGPAAKLFRAGWADLDHEVIDSLIQFDSQLERNLPAFLENIQPDDLRFLAEVYLASLPDTEILAQFPEVEHSTRVHQLTERLVALPDPRPIILQSALITLSHHEEAAGTIQPMLAELVQLIPLKGLGRMEEHELRQRLQNLLESYVRVCVASGDNQPIMDLLDRADEIDASEGQNNFYRYDDTRSLVSGLLDQEITGCLAKWPHGRIIRILPLLRHLCTPTDKTNDDDVSPAMPFVELNLVAHAMTDNMVEYEAWWQDLSDEQQGVMVNCCANWSVSQAAACLGDRTEENLDLRIRVLKAVFLTAETQGWEEQADLDIEYYEYGMPHVAFGILYSGEDTTGLLTQRELLEHGPIIAEATPTGGFAWAALAMAQSEQRQLQEALNSWQNAIDCAPKDNSYRQTCWRMEKARLLERLKRNSEALEVLKSLAPDDIDAKFKSEYTTMMEMLSDS